MVFAIPEMHAGSTLVDYGTKSEMPWFHDGGTSLGTKFDVAAASKARTRISG